MQGPNNLYEYTGLRLGDADPLQELKWKNGWQNPWIIRVLCDDRSTLGSIYGQVF